MGSEYVLVIGVVTSLLMTEFIGVSPGGVIVPGFIALFADSPLRIAITLVDALVALVAVRLLGRYAILFGRRRYATFLVVGFLARYLFERIVPSLAPDAPLLMAVGWLIPGLIAAEADRQGPGRTLVALAGGTLFVKLLWMALGS
ncbi:MAG: poly-gamma-glutamate biosynthesis protein PgsC [Spirochaetota bacterium]